MLLGQGIGAIQEKVGETKGGTRFVICKRIGMNVNKYAWVNKMQMQRKGAYHHTKIRTEVKMVCEH